MTPVEMAYGFLTTESIDRAIDLLFRWFDTEMKAGHWDRVALGFALLSLRFADMNEDRVVAVCSVSGWRVRAAEGSDAHAALILRARDRLTELVDPETAASLTRGWT